MDPEDALACSVNSHATSCSQYHPGMSTDGLMGF